MADTTDYSFHEWLELEARHFKRFQLYWTRKQKEAPFDFPAEMSESEWDEQYLLFDEANLTQAELDHTA